MQEHGTPDRIASRLQQLQSQVAEYMSGEAGRQTTAMLRQHVSRNLAAALVSVQGVQPGALSAFDGNWPQTCPWCDFRVCPKHS